MENIFNEAFNEVHKSNMSKLCTTYQETLDTMNYYAKEKNIESSFIKINENQYRVFRLSDNKTLKSINYKKVNLKQFLEL